MNKIEKLDILELMEVKGGVDVKVGKCFFGGATKCTVAGSGVINCSVAGSGVITTTGPTGPTNPPSEPTNPPSGPTNPTPITPATP